MTKREAILKKQMHNIIREKCLEMVPLATKVYYTPAFHKQKPLKITLGQFVKKDNVVQLKQAITSGNSSEAVLQLQTLGDSLLRLEARITRKKR